MRLFGKKKKEQPHEPSSFTDQRDADLRVIDALHEHGVDLSRPARVDHFFFAKKESDARAIGAALEQRSFDVDVQPAADGSDMWTVEAVHDVIVRPDTISAITASLNQLAAAHDAEYDGWGTAGPGKE
jgi:regulator of RNase E activity RraB